MNSTWSSSIDHSREDYDSLVASGVDVTTLTSLCCFGADVGSRLVRLAKKVDGMPSSVKSLGFEIWAACEVLCELAMVLTRARRNFRMAFFNAEALQEIEDCVEICDEIFHEAARGVLVAYDRLKVVAPKDEKGKGTDEMVYLSFDERTRWPLFQRRTGMMMEALMNAKLDLTLHLLVYWVAWEGESRRRSKSSILAELSLADRTAIISQIWNGKVRREQEAANQKSSNLMLPTLLSSESSISPTSIFALSRSGSSTPLDSTSPTSTVSSTSSTDSALKRFGRRFAKGSRRRLEAVGFMTPRPQAEVEEANPRDRATPDPFRRMEHHHGRTNSRETSQTRSGGSNNSSGSSERGAPAEHMVLRRAHSARPVLNVTQRSTTSHHHHAQALTTAATLPIITSNTGISSSAAQSGAASAHAMSAPPILPTSAQTFQGRPPQTPLLRSARSGTWFAGPTRAAKEGIVREWGALRQDDDDLALRRSNEQRELERRSGEKIGRNDDGQGGDARELGRKLLYAQLAAMTPVWIVPDLEDEEAATDMLVERWVKPGAVRRRMAQWEELMAFPATREEERQQYQQGGRGQPLGDEEVVMRFHFGR